MDKISKQQFATILKTELRKRNPNWNIYIEDVPKTNGVVLTALVIMSNKSNVSPTIYLEAFYEEYKAGYSLKTIMDEIERLYGECKLDGAHFDIQQFLNFDRIKERLCVKLINAEKNKKLLEQVPYRVFHDLAVVYYILLPNELCLQGIASILVNNKMVEYWDVSETDMFKRALNNTKHCFRHLVRPMQEVIMEIVYNEPEVLLEMGMPDLCDEKIMYYASNHTKLYGASFLLYDDLLEEFAREHGDFYILPSSVHELLFVPSVVGDLYEANGGDMLELVRYQKRILPKAAGCEEICSSAEMFAEERKQKRELGILADIHLYEIPYPQIKKMAALKNQIWGL